MDLLTPTGPRQALGLLGQQSSAGRHDEHIEIKDGPVGQVDPVGVGLHGLNWALDVLDVVVQLVLSRPHDVVGSCQSERHEQQPRLVDVHVVLVDHGDRRLIGGVLTTKAVRGQGSAGAGTEYHDPMSHGPPPGALSSKAVARAMIPQFGRSR